MQFFFLQFTYLNTVKFFSKCLYLIGKMFNFGITYLDFILKLDRYLENNQKNSWVFYHGITCGGASSPKVYLRVMKNMFLQLFTDRRWVLWWHLESEAQKYLFYPKIKLSRHPLLKPFLSKLKRILKIDPILQM